MGIEPTSKAWEAFVLPLNYTRKKPVVYSTTWVLSTRSGVASRAMRGALLRPPRTPTSTAWEAFVLPLNYTREAYIADSRQTKFYAEN